MASKKEVTEAGPSSRTRSSTRKSAPPQNAYRARSDTKRRSASPQNAYRARSETKRSSAPPQSAHRTRSDTKRRSVPPQHAHQTRSETNRRSPPPQNAHRTRSETKRKPVPSPSARVTRSMTKNGIVGEFAALGPSSFTRSSTKKNQRTPPTSRTIRRSTKMNQKTPPTSRTIRSSTKKNQKTPPTSRTIRRSTKKNQKTPPTSRTIRSSSNNASPGMKRKRDPEVQPDEGKKIKKRAINDPGAIQILKELKAPDDMLSSGNVRAWTLTPEEEAYKDIHDYVERSQCDEFRVKIVSIVEVVSGTAHCRRSFDENPGYKNMHRQMLWHGTLAHRIPSILEHGLLLPGNNNQLFGPGIYFADRVAKSAYFSGAPRYGAGLGQQGMTGYLLLCDVLLGKIYNNYLPDRTFICVPQGFDSIKGSGCKIPNPAMSKQVNGCTWPTGPSIDNRNLLEKTLIRNIFGDLTPLCFNEYLVFNQEFVQPKYLVKVVFLPYKTTTST